MFLLCREEVTLGERQRRSGIQPKVGAQRLHWEKEGENPSTSARLWRMLPMMAATTLWLRCGWNVSTQGSLADSATAGLEGAIPLGLSCVPRMRACLSDTFSHGGESVVIRAFGQSFSAASARDCMSIKRTERRFTPFSFKNVSTALS